MVDFTQYKPPGTYIEEDQTPLVAVIGIQPTTVAIVGPSVGYRTFTEAITLTGTTPVVLSKLGIDPSSFAVAAADGTVIESSNYATTVGGGSDANTSTLTDNTTAITRNGSGIADGQTIYVSYRYTDADYFAPVRAQDYDDVKDFYGEPLDLPSGAITSPISLAAKIAFENGASQLLLVATTGTSTSVTRQQISDAYNKLANFYDVSLIVPLPVGITGTDGSPGDVINIGADLKTHVENASADGYYRVGVLGYESSVSVPSASAAAGFASPRMVLAFPNSLNYFNGSANQNIVIGGYYLAAAYAGLISGLDVQVPFTKKLVNSFSGLPAVVLQQMTVSFKNALSDGGVAVTELSRNGNLSVRHGTTTKRDTVYTRELSLVRAKDRMITMIQDTVERASLVGIPIEVDTPLRIKGVIQGVLETAVANSTIVGYSALKVRQTSLDPSVIEVKFQYLPAYPLNYIVISFSIDTTTGIVAEAA